MRGNTYLNIDFGGKRQRSHYVNQSMTNRRAFHYSYNLINNQESEESKKETAAKKVGSAAMTSEGYSGQYDSGRVQRKLSLPAKSQYGSAGTIRKNSEENSKAIKETEIIKREYGQSNLNGNHNGLARAKNGTFDFDKIMSRPSMGQRFSDPLYEQRSLPPLPFNKPRGGSEGTIYDVDNSTKQKRMLQMSSKSHSLSNQAGPSASLVRKEGLSAVNNSEIMQGKLRKKGVVDSTDESHYQRQFLRVLNKRF